MTNREDSSAAEHETFPGPGPLTADEAKRGIHPVEQMVDAAIDRIAREREAGRDKSPNNDASNADWAHPNPGKADQGRADQAKTDRTKADRSKGDRSKAERGKRDRAAADPGHALALAQLDGPATLAMAGSARRAKARLRWKGLDVSEEFRSYADRVARGEDLPPFQGKILAEADPAFPWNPTDPARSQSRALKQQFGLWTGVALFLGLSVWVLVVQIGKQPDAAQRAAQSPLATVMLGNQPSETAPKLEDTPAVAPAVVEAAVTEQPVEPSLAVARGTTALASLPERSSTASSNPNPVVSPNPVRSAAVPSHVGTSASSATPAPAPASNPIGVFVATRPASGDLPGANVTASGALPAPPAAISIGGAGSGLATSGTAIPVAPATASAVAPAASATSSDPKKEPGREASTIGPLLVENPSF